MTMPSLHAPTVPPGWRLLTGPSLAVLAEIADTDERLPHLHAAVGSGRFDDALLVLGRSGGPPSCAAAAISGSSTSLVNPSEHTTKRSPGHGGKTQVSTAGSRSRPSERVTVCRSGCTLACSAVR